jgi:flagellar biosynthetic protein FliR
MDQWTLLIQQFHLFLLILVRVAALMVAIPFIGGQRVPRQLKVGFVLFSSFILLPVVKVETDPQALDLLSLVSGMIGELMIGMVIGLATRLVFAAVELAGELMGFQIGFGIVNVIDPLINIQMPVIAQFQALLATWVFFMVDAHHDMIRAIVVSFQYIPPLGFHLEDWTVQALLHLAGGMFALAIKIAAPLMVTLLLTNVALGVMARAAPQMNVFLLSFPLTISLGLLILGLSLPWFVILLQKAFSFLSGDVLGLLRRMG